MYFRWTVFNSLTLGIMGLTLVMVWVRFRFALETTWPLLYYAFLIGYSEAFHGALSPYWVFAGVVFGLLLRFEFMGKYVVGAIRVAELAVFGYVIVRGLQLLLLWPW